MRVLQWRRGRVAKFGAAAAVALVVLIIIVHNQMGSESSWGEDDLSPGVGPNSEKRVGGLRGMGRQPHHSYPNELPVFLGDGNPGNYEVTHKIKRQGPGEMGAAHRLRVDQRDEEERLKGVYGFNQLVSDEISLNRSVPELREEECQYWDYPKSLPKASVILVFHNEGWSTLLRTVHSVINRSPPQFLEEVLLVDDMSELEHLPAARASAREAVLQGPRPPHPQRGA